MPRFLMTDTLEILRAPATITSYGETIYKLADAAVIASGLGSCQLYFSTEYSIDRETSSRTGRIITDDYAILSAGVVVTDWIRVNGVEVFEIDGPPMDWTLRGLHHHEINIKHIEG